MSFVLVDKPAPGVTLVTLNRPARMNAMAFDVMIPFRRALEQVSQDNETRVVVLTGAGGAFCSGADLEDAGMVPNVGGLTRTTIAQRSMELLDDVIRTLRAMHQPVIGAINGPAIGGGFCLSVATDIRIASEEAYFRAAGVNNGLTSTELGLSYLLPRPSARRARLRSCSRVETLMRRRPNGSVWCHRWLALPSCSAPPTEWPSASSATRGWGSSSPSGCCGRASTHRACTRTWTTKAPPSSTCD
jgi:hypothetical protein